MFDLDSFLLNEAITIGGQKPNDTKKPPTGTGNDSMTGGAGTDSTASGAADITPPPTTSTSNATSLTPTTGGTDSTPSGAADTSPPEDNPSTPNTDGAAEDQDDTDYTKMKPDDDAAGGEGDAPPPEEDEDNYTGMQPNDDDQNQSAADQDDYDYGEMQPEDNPNPEDQTPADDANPTDNPPPGDDPAAGDAGGAAENDSPDYTSMSPDDDNEMGADGNDQIDNPEGASPGEVPSAGAATTGTNLDDGTNGGNDPSQAARGLGTEPAQGGGGTGTNIPGGDSPGGYPGANSPEAGGAAESDNVDYTSMSPDQDNPDNPSDAGGGGDGSTGGTDPNGNPEGQEQSSDDDESSGEGDGNGQNELKEIEARLFADLTPEQIQIQDNELKVQYINLYSDIEKVENRVNSIVKTDTNEEVIDFISKKLIELKEMTHYSLIQAYQTRTYMQNVMEYNKLLAQFASIGRMLKAVSEKDKINDNIEDDNDENSNELEDIINTQMDSINQ